MRIPAIRTGWKPPATASAPCASAGSARRKTFTRRRRSSNFPNGRKRMDTDATTPRLELQSLLDEACRQAGGRSDFGDASFREGLDVLCQSLEAEANLSPLGRQLLHHKYVEQ